MKPIQCPDCGASWSPSTGEPCPGCGLSWGAVEDAADFLDRQAVRSIRRALVWPVGIRSRVSREAYNAVGRARAFPHMTPAEREAAAVSYDQLKETK